MDFCEVRCFLTRSPALNGTVWALAPTRPMGVDQLAAAAAARIRDRFLSESVVLCTFDKAELAGSRLLGKEPQAAAQDLTGTGHWRCDRARLQPKKESGAAGLALRPEATAETTRFYREQQLGAHNKAARPGFVPPRKLPFSCWTAELQAVAALGRKWQEDLLGVDAKSEKRKSDLPLHLPLFEGELQLHVLVRKAACDTCAAGWYHVEWPFVLPSDQVRDAPSGFFGHVCYQSDKRTLSHVGCVLTPEMRLKRLEHVGAFAMLLASVSLEVQSTGRMIAQHLPPHAASLVSLLPPPADGYELVDGAFAFKFPKEKGAYDANGGCWSQAVSYKRRAPGGPERLTVSQRVFRTKQGAEQYLRDPDAHALVEGLPKLGPLGVATAFGWDRILEFPQLPISDEFQPDDQVKEAPCLFLCAVWARDCVVCKLLGYFRQRPQGGGLPVLEALVGETDAWTRQRSGWLDQALTKFTPKVLETSAHSPPNATQTPLAVYEAFA